MKFVGKIILNNLLIILLTGICFSKEANDSIFVNNIIKNKEYLHNKLAPLVAKYSWDDSRSRQRFDSLLMVLKPDSTCLSTQEHIYRSLVNLEYEGNNSILITDTVILDIFINSFDVSDRRLLENLINIIYYNCPRDYLKARSDIMKNGIKRFIMGWPNPSDRYKEESGSLLCILTLSQQEKDSLLQLKNIPIYCRASLGDKEAQNQVIKTFHETTSFSIKRDYAQFLGDIGTAEAAKALLMDFNSDLVWNGRTIRLYIVKALACIHPQNNLLTDIRPIIAYGERAYCKLYGITDKKEILKIEIKDIKGKMQGIDYTPVINYLNQIKAWGEKEYLITIPGEITNSYLLYRFGEWDDFNFWGLSYKE